jgi:catechol 2,3-dioxygenase-like lactoylglutathione lyase family enzyme
LNRTTLHPRRAASIVATSIFRFLIVASNARLASAPPPDSIAQLVLRAPQKRTTTAGGTIAQISVLQYSQIFATLKCHSRKRSTLMAATVRYIVTDVDAAIAFYVTALGFSLDMHPAPGFAALSKDGLRLLINRQGAGGAGQPMTGGATPQPGGWNRIQIETANLETTVAVLRAAGHRFRSEIIHGNGGKQILIEDPSGNPVELFEPMQRTA